MYLKPKQIQELWNMRLYVLKMRDPIWLVEVSLIPVALFLLYSWPSEYKSLFDWLPIALYAILTIITIVILLRIRAKPDRAPYAHNLRILLYQIFDQASLIIIATSSWGIGYRLLATATSMEHAHIKYIQMFLVVSLVILTLMAVLYSPYATRQKADVRKVSRQNPKPLRWILIVLGSLPALGVLIGILLSSDNPRQSSGLGLVAILLLSFGYFMLPLMMLVLSELVLLVLNKWPKITKVGRNFEVETVEKN